MSAQTTALESKSGGFGNFLAGFARLRQNYPHYYLVLLILGVSFLFAVVPIEWAYPEYTRMVEAGEVGVANKIPWWAAPFLMDLSTWAVLALGGLAMGVLLFIMASGMTLTFGLMDVLNLGHGAFVTFGAYLGMATLGMFSSLTGTAGSGTSLIALVPALLVAGVAGGLLGWFFERVVIKPVYGNPLKQILVTVGGAIVIVQVIIVVWGGMPFVVARPDALRGSLNLGGGVLVETYRVLAVAVGLFIYWAMIRIINKTKVGILIRAGVESPEMVEILGYRVRLLFMAVFVAGTVLAAMGGVLWMFYAEAITPQMGDGLMVSIIVVIIIGGMGSITGCFFGSIAVGLINLMIAFIWPPLGGMAAVGLLVAVLLWRPQGLIPVLKF